MREVFLSASVPEPGRPDFDETANPFLIQFAVREFVTVCLGRRRIIWGGHPSITPMVHAVCSEFGMDFDAPVMLYQSEYFRNRFPETNDYFDPVITPEVDGNKDASLTLMRRAMLSRPMEAAIFIGGMEGIFEEYDLCHQLQPDARVIALAAPGGAARQLAERLPNYDQALRVDFSRLFYQYLGIQTDEPRELLGRDGPYTLRPH